jgi:cobalt-zinc-cadmium efflux system outer membrane protein
MHKVFIFFTIIIFLISLTRGEEKLSLEQCISIALEKSPLIQSTYQQYRASLARLNQARAFPQPEINLDYDLQPTFFNFKKTGESYLGLSQLIEFPGRRYLRGKIAKKESDETYCEFDLIKLDLVFQVKKAFYELLLAYEKQKYVEENVRLARDFLSKASEKYRSGDVAKIEMIRAKVEAAKSDNQMRVALNNIKLARARLNFLLAGGKLNPVEIKGRLSRLPLDFSLQTLIKKALLFRPEIKKAELSLEKESFSKKQAYLSYLPDLSLGIARHRIEGEPNSWDVSFSFQLPLFFWQKQRGEVAEAKANIEAVKSELEYLRLNISLEVENAFLDAVSFRNQIDLFEEEVLTEAEQVYEMSMISYKEGKTGSIELIESRRTLIELRGLYAEALFNYCLSLAELEKFVGTKIYDGGKND